VQIAKNAFMMIHNGWAMAAGDPDEMRKTADVLEKLCGAIAQSYADKTGKSVEECRKAMDDETWFDAAEAKAWGLADEIEDEGDEAQMAASVMVAAARFQNVPPALRTLAARLERTSDGGNRKGNHMDKIVGRDGKWFLGDAEVDVADVLGSVKPPDPAPAIEKAVAQAREAGIAEGRKAEAEYRAMFTTVVAAAKLAPESAAEFEKNFYGRAEADLKFLASHAIGERAKPVGEGAPGNAEGEQKTDDEKADKALVDAATTRFTDNLEVRRMFGLSSLAQPEDAGYQAALKRYVARERQWAKDQKTNGTTVAVSK
jgi:hypothetical protein